MTPDIQRPRTITPRRGFWLAIALALLFMVVTAVQSVATLLFRMRSDVMKAATGSIWSGEIAGEVVHFVVAQMGLHLAFGVAIWFMARATTAAWPRTRPHFGRLLLVWFCLLAAAVIAYNAFWFPRTGLGAYYHDAAAIPIGPFSIGQFVYLGVLAACVVTLLAAARVAVSGIGTRRLKKPLVLGLGVAALGFASAFAVSLSTPARTANADPRPNVILLGIDSLRLDQLRRFGGTGTTPNLDRFLASADIVRDTTTPVARTFPSWSAILSGRDPSVTGVRFNLAPRDVIKVNPTLGDALRGAGYHTIYSTDEVRFANIDQTYGFDQVITPPIGAADFVIGNYNELPLVSVVANTRVGRWLFPYSYGNRGVATLFQPATYLSRLDREVSFDEGPTLFITHLTVSHWPYFVSDTPFSAAKKKNEGDRPIYRIGVQAADRMFGEVVAMLEHKGALENAIVVILSDHGEALALPGDTMIGDKTKIEGLRSPLMVMDAGHGQSVLSPIQYQVLLGFRTFGPGAGFEANGRDLQGGATVEDISPTLLSLVGVPGDPLATTGLSLAPILRGDPGVTRVAGPERVRFTETDLKVLPGTDGAVDEIATAKQNSKFFEVIGKTGRMSVRKGFMPLSLAFKERAAFTDNLLLAAIPAGPDAHQYVLVDKATHQGRLLLGRPGPEAPEAQYLWDVMWKHYDGELRQPVSTVWEDWPKIDEAWRTFFTRRATLGAAQANNPPG